MIVNEEQDNLIEGKYLFVNKIIIKDSSIVLNMPSDFYVNNSNCNKWILGWGTNKPLYDAGVENLRIIKKIDMVNKIIFLGKLLRGEGFPQKNQRVVLWNTQPSGFINPNEKPVINTKLWPEFSGSSVHFSSVVFDSLLGKWVMIFNECDTNKISIYAAISDNLTDWEPANNGNPVLRDSDFIKCVWAGADKERKVKQTPFTSDIIRHENKWYLFMDGCSDDGKRQIGLAISKKSVIGPYHIIDKPVLSPGRQGTWNDDGCFYAKVIRYGSRYIMFYDGRNYEGNERVGMAFSNDLIYWENSENNPVIDQHIGWRSAIGCTEPNYIEIRNDSILLIIAGVKKFKVGAWHHYITGRMYLYKSGNVDDAQLGVFLSVNGGKSFVPHIFNPVYVNNYSNIFENEHLGGNIELIKTDTLDYLFYQGKSSYQGMKYNVLMKFRKHK
ncbi:MAG: hypothetical protein COX07_04580 [Bacteroidetes bacterium CG23_combo_of_CG06-09_8_20_14_all_32_9]|nr:MAG: hypothetical protein COX07_04580 [Bacteroidetes bacterium CG23_combo_of_CG06-09_8_20_14_all_32_9]